LKTWQPQEERLLELPGKGPEDQAIGGHPDVVVQGDRAYLFYFTHPGRVEGMPAATDTKRSLIQVTELHHANGKLTCDRDQPTYIQLTPPGKQLKKRL
jgi:hypothetical protein